MAVTRNKRHTITDIMKKTGLARGTVSMAINNDPRIASKTREKVKRAMEVLDYRPNEAARRLRGGKSGVIAFISPRFSSAFSTEIISAAEETAYELKKYHRGIMPFSTWNLKKERDGILFEILRERKADAVVMLSEQPPESIVEEYRASGIPLVVVEFVLDNAHSVTLDNYNGGLIAGRYLLEKYGKDTAIITGVIEAGKEKDTHPSAKARLEGFKAALLSAGAVLKKNRLKSVYTYSRAEGGEIMEAFIKSGDVPRSVFCAAGDEVAIGVIETAAENKIRVPQDMAVLGFDDIQAAGLIHPSITTIKQPAREIGKNAFMTALGAIEGTIKAPVKIVIKPELIVRESA